MNLDAVLFDFDGTLAPNLDLPDMRRQVIELTRQHEVPEHVYADQYIVEVIDVSAQHVRKAGDPRADRYFADAHQLITQIEMDAAAVTDPFPGVPDLLDGLRRRAVKTGIVTRNCRAAVMNVFPDVLARVDALHARGDALYLKPDPRHFEQNLAELEVSPDRAAIVGDSRLDMSVGAELGMTCVGVLTGSADRSALEQAGAHLVLESCLNLVSLIDQGA